MADAVDSVQDLPRSSNGYGGPSKTPTSSSAGSQVSRLVRTPEVEPRSIIWVYDYSKNETKRMKQEELMSKVRDPTDFSQVSIPMKPGRVVIQAEGDEFGGSRGVAARVHISMGLRVQRWLGLQKRLYIVDSMKGGEDIKNANVLRKRCF